MKAERTSLPTLHRRRYAASMMGTCAGRDFIARQGETVSDAARRVQGDALHTPLRLAETHHDAGDRLMVMHGRSSRVPCGVVTGGPIDDRIGAPIAPGLPQGSVVPVEGGRERIVHPGTGHGRT